MPIGYDVIDRKLVINEAEAESVRRIFARYLEVGSLHELGPMLEADGITTKHRQMSSGRTFGGTPFRRGGLAHLLNNPVYVGEVRHRQTVYPGEHDAIIDLNLWDAVQARLRRVGERRGVGRADEIADLHRRRAEDLPHDHRRGSGRAPRWAGRCTAPAGCRRFAS